MKILVSLFIYPCSTVSGVSKSPPNINLSSRIPFVRRSSLIHMENLTDKMDLSYGKHLTFRKLELLINLRTLSKIVDK